VTGKDGQTFGDTLESAVREFQRDYGLSADGRVGPKTVSALRRAMDELVPGTFRVDEDTRNRVKRLHQEVLARVEELNALCTRGLGVESRRPFSQFTLTRTPGGKIEMKFDPGVDVPSASLATVPGAQKVDYIDTRSVDPEDPAAPGVTALARAVNTGAGIAAVCYIDPPGICVPCSIVIVIVIR
jgi:hypothetical protein